MNNEYDLFKREYFTFYDFCNDSEKQFQKHPQITSITTGFCYRGGLKPVYTVISAFQSEKEALSSLDIKSTIEVLEELREEILESSLNESQYFIHMINLKIRELEREHHKGSGSNAIPR